ncbi:hypothetical protein ACFL02_03985 [Planctomycetota bacterium]
MDIFLIVFGVSAVFSVPLTKYSVKPVYDNIYEGEPLRRYLIYVPMSIFCLFYAFFPFWIASEWAKEFLDNNSPLTSYKGMLLMLCWLIVVCQLFYRLGFVAGKKKNI